jgi:hypothetical protein
MFPFYVIISQRQGLNNNMQRKLQLFTHWRKSFFNQICNEVAQVYQPRISKTHCFFNKNPHHGLLSNPNFVSASK